MYYRRVPILYFNPSGFPVYNFKFRRRVGTGVEKSRGRVSVDKEGLRTQGRVFLRDVFIRKGKYLITLNDLHIWDLGLRTQTVQRQTGKLTTSSPLLQPIWNVPTTLLTQLLTFRNFMVYHVSGLYTIDDNVFKWEKCILTSL